MAIQLRTNKASALTYNEMDRNFSSFFYSASIDNGSTLRLWYTGSSTLNTAPGDDFGPARFVPINLQPTTGIIPTLTVAGASRAIQFRHSTNPILDADDTFLYNTSLQLGIGVSIPASNTKIHARGTANIPATLRLETTNTAGPNKRAAIDFYEGATSIGSIGRHDHNDNHIYITTQTSTPSTSTGNIRVNIGSNTNAGAWTGVGLGIGTLIPQYSLHVEGTGYFTSNVGIGIVPSATTKLSVYEGINLPRSAGEYKHLATFTNIPLSSVNNLHTSIVRTSTGDDWTSSGMRIQQQVDSQYMGYLQYSGNENNFGISLGTGASSINGLPTQVSERLRIDQYGNVGINTVTPNAKLDVNGDTIITGSFKVTQNATVQSLSGGSAGVTSTLVANSAGLLQKIDAAPVPKGGIIMWSGAISAIPTGWCLCNGQTINGIVTPNLQDRFIVGAGSVYAVGTTGGSADAVVVNHSHQATSTASPHNHSYAAPLTAGSHPGGSSGYDRPNGLETGTTSTVNVVVNTVIGQATDGVSGTNKNLPPYYALAYILYGGQV